MKKALALLLAVCLVTSIVGCSGEEEAGGTDATTGSTTESTAE